MVAAWTIQLARGVLALALGLTITLTLDHSAFFGLVTFGVFALLAGAALLAAALRGADSGRIRALFLIQAAATLVAGAAALLGLNAGVAYLAVVVGAWGVLTGLLEGASGLLSRSRSPLARDWMLTGALTVAVGVVAFVLPPDFAQAFVGEKGASGTLTSSVILIGVLGAWGVLVGVLQLISAFTVRSDRTVKASRMVAS